MRNLGKHEHGKAVVVCWTSWLCFKIISVLIMHAYIIVYHLPIETYSSCQCMHYLSHWRTQAPGWMRRVPSWWARAKAAGTPPSCHVSCASCWDENSFKLCRLFGSITFRSKGWKTDSIVAMPSSVAHNLMQLGAPKATCRSKCFLTKPIH